MTSTIQGRSEIILDFIFGMLIGFHKNEGTILLTRKVR